MSASSPPRPDGPVISTSRRPFGLAIRSRTSLTPGVLPPKEATASTKTGPATGLSAATDIHNQKGLSNVQSAGLKGAEDVFARRIHRRFDFNAPESVAEATSRLQVGGVFHVTAVLLVLYILWYLGRSGLAMTSSAPDAPLIAVSEGSEHRDALRVGSSEDTQKVLDTPSTCSSKTSGIETRR
ncbi:hypothetical protein B0H14DRAFT_2614572 [Mycena olivaceomarginata]|nr:hypothetical protein B0H14DRAFT_2614572 [Mycena olivaceomarginata]